MESIKLTKNRQDMMTIMNFDSLFDVLYNFPYRYDILKLEPISFEKHDKKITVSGMIVSEIKIDYIHSKMIKTSFDILYDKLYIKVILFNRFTYSKILKKGLNIVAYGTYNVFKNEIVPSTFFVGELENGIKIIPIYSISSKINMTQYKNFVKFLYEKLSDRLIDRIPNEFIKKYKLINLKEAIYKIHFPLNEEDLKQANRYLKYNEFLSFCLKGNIKKQLLSSTNVKDKQYKYSYVNNFINSLPFKLTKSQVEAYKEILSDLDSKYSMSRLLQGDVGSGKTIVGLIALVANYSASFQGALMAPTEILAMQHFNKIKEILHNFDKNIKVALLVSSLSSSEKKQIINDIKNNEIDIVIGTHSLISKQIEFNNLGLAIVDEQHKFGVKQRLELKEKGKNVDILYMSATPIPRTLASTIYMDMDISTIDSYPFKERVIETKYIKGNSIKTIKKEIDNYLKTNQKIFVVCPCINESEAELKDVYSVYEEFKNEFENENISLVHGKLSNELKDISMEEFKNGTSKILIATTIIEVGIDIKDANMIIIFNAERYGLASIHQLRGRIARNNAKGYCYLLSDLEDENVKDRLSFIASTNDGFKISEYDLKNRGAGDMLGIMQSGKTYFKIASLFDDFNILKEASKDAKYILNNKDNYQSIINLYIKRVKDSENYID